MQSTNAGIPFNISGAYSTSDELDLTIQNTVENSLGKNEVSGIRGASASSLGARTVYSNIKLVSENEFEVRPGDNGFGPNSSFSELGFVQGSHLEERLQLKFLHHVLEDLLSR